MSVYRFLFKNRSLWFKFSIMTVLPVIFAAVFLVVNFVRSVETSMQEKTRAAVQELNNLASLAMSNAYVIYNKNLLDNFVDTLADKENILFAAVVDASDARILAHSHHKWDGRLYDPADPHQKAASASVEEIELLTFPLTVEQKKYGDVIVGYSKSGIRREIDVFRMKVLTITGSAIILGVLLAIALAQFVSRPIRMIASQVQKIGSGDFDQKIVYDGRDALGQLSDSFNGMVSNLRDRQAELITINTIAEKLHQSLDWKTVASQAVDILAEYSQSPSVAVFIPDWDQQVLRLNHHRGLGEETVQIASTLPLEGSLTGLAVKNREIIVSRDITQDERLDKAVRDALIRDGFRGSTICMPLLYQDQVMGVINFIFREPYSWTENKRATFMAIGRTIALALANAEYVTRIEKEIRERKRAEEALRRSIEEMTALNTLANKAGQFLSVDQVVGATLESLRFPLNPDVIMIYLREGDALILKGIHTKNAVPDEEQNVHQVGECLCGLCASEGRPAYSTDIHSDPRCTRNECKKAGMRSFVALPLFSEDRVIGVLGLASEEERDFTTDKAFLETLAGQVAVVLVNAILYEQIQKQAAELERRVAERTASLEVAMERAQEADRIKSAFLASMSHELRTPLNSIIGFTGILLQGLAGPLNEEQHKQMGMVQNSARHLLHLINDVLDISKIEAGQLELSSERFNLAESLTKAIQIVTPLAEKKGLKLVSDVAPEVGGIVSDRRRVEQVLINLINNAVKFTEEGEVRVESKTEGTHIVTSIQDTGIGINQEDMNTLFEAFRQIDTGVARRYEGTGLGLSICKRLIEKLGGRIWAKSEGDGKGSTFTFTLPLTPGAEYEN